MYPTDDFGKSQMSGVLHGRMNPDQFGSYMRECVYVFCGGGGVVSSKNRIS